MTFCDAHIHVVQVGRQPDFAAAGDSEYCACTCAHAPAEFEETEQLLSAAAPGVRIVRAFGLHPQAPYLENASFLENLLAERRIQAVGEAGFDFFTPEFASHEREQEEAWQIQLALAERYKVPLVNHTRKALERLFRDSAHLKRLPAVVFHSFMGSPQDAASLLRRGINGFFSFGKPILNGKKSAISCVQSLPLDRLLLETDAPYQTLKGETATQPEEIMRVYEKAATLRGMTEEALGTALKENFMRAYSG